MIPQTYFSVSRYSYMAADIRKNVLRIKTFSKKMFHTLISSKKNFFFSEKEHVSALEELLEMHKTDFGKQKLNYGEYY